MTSSVDHNSAVATENAPRPEIGSGGSGKTRTAQEPSGGGVEKDRLNRNFREEEAARQRVGIRVIEGEAVHVGPRRGTGPTASNERSENAIAQNGESTGNPVLTDQEKADNLAAVTEARTNALRCIATRTPAGKKISDSDSFEQCLLDILGPHIDLSVFGQFLCDLVGKTEDRVKDQIDRVGDNLVDAAENLINGQVAQALLGEAGKILSEIDPGVIANCLGAQELIATIQGELDKADQAVEDAAEEAVAPVVEAIEEKSQAAQDYVDFRDAGGLCEK